MVCGILFVVQAMRDLWHLLHSNHSAEYWGEDMRADIVFVVIGLILGIASLRWFIGLVRRDQPSNPTNSSSSQT
jgi:hypothetical protein